MPPRWPREPDRKDPDYRRLDDRMNFAVHVGIFLTITSGSWFFKLLQEQPWSWVAWMTEIWIAVLLIHGLYIFALADYSGGESQKKGGKKPEKAS
jgi:2TM domain